MKSTHLELTPFSIIVGLIVGVLMTAANVYLGLYAGMTVSASIPAAVVGLGLMKALRRSSILEANIVQTMASAGESLAAGVIFTIPALVLVGAWNKFEFWPTTLIAICGGLLGVVFMIPLRRALIVDNKQLTYPEGVACATVLKAGMESKSQDGLFAVIKGLLIGAGFKFASTGLGLLKGSVEWATKAGGATFFMGSDISPALMAVGYIVKLEIAVLVFMGGCIGWVIGIPLLGGAEGTGDMAALDSAWTLWSKQVRYVGVGAMVVGGVASIFSVRQGIVSGLTSLKDNYSKSADQVSRENRDIPLMGLLVIFILNLGAMFWIYQSLIGNVGLTLFACLMMFLASFLFVAVSSYVVGLVGGSNNPVSGMTISALLGTAAFFLVLGFEGESAIMATLGVAAVVCCAACTSSDCSQDLKTGVLVGATPANQQWAQVLGVAIPAFVIAPVLTLLHHSYGIGTGLKAPQATLFASITNGLFGTGEIPLGMVMIGAALGVGILVLDGIQTKRGGFRFHLMPIAVGIYLPVTLSVPMFLGGIIAYVVDKKVGSRPEGQDMGVLVSSGLIAGEALMGVLIAVLIYFSMDLKVGGLPHAVVEWVSVGALLILAGYLRRVALR